MHKLWKNVWIERVICVSAVFPHPGLRPSRGSPHGASHGPLIQPSRHKDSMGNLGTSIVGTSWKMWMGFCCLKRCQTIFHLIFQLEDSSRGSFCVDSFQSVCSRVYTQHFWGEKIPVFFCKKRSFPSKRYFDIQGFLSARTSMDVALQPSDYILGSRSILLSYQYVPLHNFCIIFLSGLISAYLGPNRWSHTFFICMRVEFRFGLASSQNMRICNFRPAAAYSG